MNDPRQYRNDHEWCRSAIDEAAETHSPDSARLLYDDICARLNAKDEIIAAAVSLLRPDDRALIVGAQRREGEEE